MSLIDKLLASASQQELKDCESAAQLHLKQVLTTINKHTLEDITPALIRQRRCILGCYDYYAQNLQVEKAAAWEQVQQLRDCKEKCRGEQKELEKFLDNINFYSKKKFEGCSSKCSLAKEEERNSCLWECYNRLDRRYKQYWSGQRSNIEAKYQI